MNALFDTNILIDYLRGIAAARDELDRYREKAISPITWIEVMVGADAGMADRTRDFLDDFQLVPIDRDVAERAVTLRRAHRVKLPDAVIWASAQVNALLLVTRDARGFPEADPGIRMPYVLPR